MKKLVLSAMMLLTSCLSFMALAGSPYGHCDTGASNSKFCQCFISNCDKVFGSGQCQYGRLIGYFNHVGAARACSANGRGTDQQECINGINHYISVCG